MAYTNSDCQRARADFPALAREFNNHPIAFLDGPGGTQVPEAVLQAMRLSYVERNANYEGKFSTSIAVTAALREARAAAADFLGADDPSTISFGANMTTLNFSLSHALLRSMSPGDEILITELDHEANRGPWLKLAAHGIRIREATLDADGTLDLDDIAAKITPRTRLVALSMASNALGTVTAVAPIRAMCRAVGAWLLVDAVHYAAHFPVDVLALDVDFLLCSAYKFYGPHVGILYARAGLLETLDTDRLGVQKSIAPYRIETGTLNHAAIAGVEAAVDYIAGWGSGDDRRTRLRDAMRAIHEYEFGLAANYAERASKIPGVTVWGPGFDDSPRAPTVSLTMERHRAEHIASHLSSTALQVWHGHFYAPKVLEKLNLVESGGLLRVGISMYNDSAEIDRLISALQALA